MPSAARSKAADRRRASSFPGARRSTSRYSAAAISAAIGAQGVALMSRQLIDDEVRGGRLMQPFGPELAGKPFHLVYPESSRDDPTVLAVREWVMKVPGGLCEMEA